MSAQYSPRRADAWIHFETDPPTVCYGDGGTSIDTCEIGILIDAVLNMQEHYHRERAIRERRAKLVLVDEGVPS